MRAMRAMQQALRAGIHAARAHLRRRSRGMAVVEFALAFPILLTMLGGVYDCTQIFKTWRRMSVAADAVAQITTIWAAQQGTKASWLNMLNAQQLQQAGNAIFAYFPQWSQTSGFSVTISAVDMVPNDTTCTGSACTYTSHIAWSSYLPSGNKVLRDCMLIQAGQPNDPSLRTLPDGVLNGGLPLLVVDVKYTYKPLLIGALVGNIDMTRSSYLPLRVANMGSDVGNGVAFSGMHYALFDVRVPQMQVKTCSPYEQAMTQALAGTPAPGVP